MYKWHFNTLKSLLIRGERLPHALLLHGAEGIGVFDACMGLAHALLCESAEAGGLACGRCNACNWFAQGNHPDFRLVQPDSHVVEADDGEEGRAVTAREREKKSDQIRIDQVRELATFLNVGAHRGGRRVLVLHPADAMNTATQNALLKNLEEPGPRTHFLLATARPHRMLPTIRSRCQAVVMPRPARDEALVWLRETGIDAPEALLDMAGGAPLAAAALAGRGDFLAGLTERFAAQPVDALGAAAYCQNAHPVEVVNALYRWCYDLLACALADAPRYHGSKREVLARQSRGTSPKLVAGFLRRVSRARSLAEHPLNPRLFMEELFLDFAATLEGRTLQEPA